MKKLMVMAVAALTAGLLQAGAVTWGTRNLYTAKSGTDGTFSTTLVAAGEVTVSGSLWLLTQTQWQGYYDIYTDKGYDAMSAKIYADLKGTKASKEGSTTTSASGITFQNATTADNRTAVYAAIILEMNQGGTDYYIANLGDWVATSSGSTQNQMGSKQLGQKKTSTGYLNHGTTVNITGWTAAATPEPTSAMLLLLGFAGLALRRRRV